MNTRRGVSLVELLVVMSISTVVLVLSAVLIGRAMQAESLSRRFNDVERSAWRLSESFRRDVHSARSAAVLNQELHDGAFLQLTLSSGDSIEYSEDSGIVRRRLVKGGNMAGQETFVFPAYTKLSLHKVFEPRRLELSLTADPIATPQTTGNRPWNQYATRVSVHAEAVIARDLRFAVVLPPVEVRQ